MSLLGERARRMADVSVSLSAVAAAALRKSTANEAVAHPAGADSGKMASVSQSGSANVDSSLRTLLASRVRAEADAGSRNSSGSRDSSAVRDALPKDMRTSWGSISSLRTDSTSPKVAKALEIFGAGLLSASKHLRMPVEATVVSPVALRFAMSSVGGQTAVSAPANLGASRAPASTAPQSPMQPARTLEAAAVMGHAATGPAVQAKDISDRAPVVPVAAEPTSTAASASASAAPRISGKSNESLNRAITVLRALRLVRVLAKGIQATPRSPHTGASHMEPSS